MFLYHLWALHHLWSTFLKMIAVIITLLGAPCCKRSRHLMDSISVYYHHKTCCMKTMSKPVAITTRISSYRYAGQLRTD